MSLFSRGVRGGGVCASPASAGARARRPRRCRSRAPLLFAFGAELLGRGERPAGLRAERAVRRCWPLRRRARWTAVRARPRPRPGRLPLRPRRHQPHLQWPSWPRPSAPSPSAADGRALLRRGRLVAACAGPSLAGLLPYLYLPLRARGRTRASTGGPRDASARSATSSCAATSGSARGSRAPADLADRSSADYGRGASRRVAPGSARLGWRRGGRTAAAPLADPAAAARDGGELRRRSLSTARAATSSSGTATTSRPISMAALLAAWGWRRSRPRAARAAARSGAPAPGRRSAARRGLPASSTAAAIGSPRTTQPHAPADAPARRASLA